MGTNEQATLPRLWYTYSPLKGKKKKMSKKGYKRNSFFSDTFRVSSISLRGFRFRDLKSSTNRDIATQQKKELSQIREINESCVKG